MKLGRNEDPSFVIKTMVVQAAWPGATIDETLKQVTERLERKLQETPQLDYIRSFTRPGLTTIFVNLKGSATAREVPDIWYHVRKSIGDIRPTLPAGVVGPGFNDDFGDTFGIIYGFTADGFTQRELRDYVEDIRSKLLHVPDVSKIEILGAQDERIFVEFSMEELANLGIDRSAVIAALQAQNVVQPAGLIQTGDEILSVRVSGSFRSEQDIATNLAVGGRMVRLGDIAPIRRGFADPPQPMFRVNGEPAIGLAIAMRDGGDILALGANIKTAIDERHRRTAAWNRSAPRRRSGRDRRQRDFGIHGVAVAGGGDHPRGQLHRTRRAAGPRGGARHSADPRHRLRDDADRHIDMQRISLGALIIALALLVDDAMTTIDATLTRLKEATPGSGRVVRLSHLRLRHARRHAGHHRGLHSGRFRRQRRGRIHLLAVRSRRDRPDRVVVRRSHLCARAGRGHPLAPPGGRGDPSLVSCSARSVAFSASPSACDG